MPKVAPIKITYADGTTKIVKHLDGKLKPAKRRRRKGRQPRERAPRDVLAVAAALDREWQEVADADT